MRSVWPLLAILAAPLCANAASREDILDGEAILWYVRDHRGDVTAAVDVNGKGGKRGQGRGFLRGAGERGDNELLALRTISPYGGDLASPDPHRGTVESFTGQRAMAGTGLLDFNARQYAPSIGRFLQRDPLTSRNPLECNRYAYCIGNPITMHDPDGKKARRATLEEGIHLLKTIKGYNMPPLLFRFYLSPDIKEHFNIKGGFIPMLAVDGTNSICCEESFFRKSYSERKDDKIKFIMVFNHELWHVAGYGEVQVHDQTRRLIHRDLELSDSEKRTFIGRDLIAQAGRGDTPLRYFVEYAYGDADTKSLLEFARDYLAEGGAYSKGIISTIRIIDFMLESRKSEELVNIKEFAVDMSRYAKDSIFFSLSGPPYVNGLNASTVRY